MDTSVFAVSTSHTPSGWSWLLGDDPQRRTWLQRMLIAYGLLLLLQVVRAAGLSLGEHPLDELSWPLAYDLLWMGTCFAMVRTGASSRWADPGMTLVQVVLALLSVLLSFALVDVGRGAALPLMGVTLALGLYHLSARQILIVGGLALGVMAACTWALSLLSAPGLDATQATLGLASAALALPMLAWAAHGAAQFRRQQAAQRTALQEALSQLDALTTQDELTGLVNHRHMQDLLATECKRHSRGGRAFCVAMLDIDQLQQVRQDHGPAHGDDVIKQLAHLSEAHLRASDVMARWSGEEFLILMPETDLDGGARSLERLRQHLFTRWGFYHEGRWVPMNCSAGVTRYRSGEPLAQTLERAEQALQAARAQGRDRVVSA